MGKIPNELRETIARNIKENRQKKFPGRGGGKKCAEAFGVSPQQWSPWERGKRTPDELRLKQIADFFGVTVEDLRRDNRKEPTKATPPPPRDSPHNEGMATRDYEKVYEQIAGIDFPPPPGWQPDAPGSPASFFWLARHFIRHVQRDGLRLDKQCLDYIVGLLRNPPQ